MLSVSNGNLDDLSILFEKYHGMIYHYFLRKSSNNTVLSQDLTQTVFERILRYKDSFKEDYHFKSWIYRIASNAYMDHFRENKLKLSDIELVKEIPDQSDPEENSSKDQYHSILQAMNELSDSDREIIQLSKIENLRIKEIAEILDLSESAVKVKIHRAVKRLKNILFNNKS